MTDQSNSSQTSNHAGDPEEKNTADSQGAHDENNKKIKTDELIDNIRHHIEPSEVDAGHLADHSVITHDPAEQHTSLQGESGVNPDPEIEDDLFSDIRRSLALEEAERDAEKQAKNEKGIIRRVTKLLKPEKPNSPEPVDSPAPNQESLPAVTELPDWIADNPSLADEINSEKVDAFFADLLDASNTNQEQEEEPAPSHIDPFVYDEKESKDLSQAVEADMPFIPELFPVQDKAEEKPAVVEPEQIKAGSDPVQRPVNDRESAFDNMRDIALESYNETPNAKEADSKDSAQKKLRKLGAAEKAILFGGAAFLLVAVCVISLGFLLTTKFAQATAVPTANNLPFPAKITLPGGWSFDLHRGYIQNGAWKPQGAEWLTGTEVCKWVAIPWNEQLEAVVRTLTTEDSLLLTMSNADTLSYKVYSIQNIPVDQISALETSSNCLLLILSNEATDTRWVVTGIP